MLRAREASHWAYSPYSGICVGAAVTTEDGRTFAGCNVENASYGLAICAERAAIFAAVAGGARRIVALAVTCRTADGSLAGTGTPCGACRQVMQEFMEPDSPVQVDGVGEFTLGQLLPLPFHP